MTAHGPDPSRPAGATAAPGPARHARPRPSDAPWQARLDEIVETMREMSRQTDPQAMVRAYGQRMRAYYQYDGFVSLSRRGLEAPFYRVTRSSTWTEDIDPWRDRHKLPLLQGGILGELLYGDRPRIINDLHVAPDDPGAPFLRGARALTAIPHYDGGVGLNMVCTFRTVAEAFDEETFPETVWLSNLFGRATNTLVLSRQLREAYRDIDRELKVVADIQRSLLPSRLPPIPSLDLAAYYQTSRNAGGDLYDFFELPGGRWGVLIADVSGHGTPAAVVMAIIHAIAHQLPVVHDQPAELLRRVNRELATRYTADTGTFATAFYGVFDQQERTLTYSSAGHNPPLVRRAQRGDIDPLDHAQGLPLGILADSAYAVAHTRLQAGDTLALYTDGITEARGPGGRMYGEARLGASLAVCPLRAGGELKAESLMTAILEDLRGFADGTAQGDDRTLLVGHVR